MLISLISCWCKANIRYSHYHIISLSCNIVLLITHPEQTSLSIHPRVRVLRYLPFLSCSFLFPPFYSFQYTKLVVGEVEEVGEGVEGFKKGDKVFGSIPNGAYAEKLVIDASAVHLLPKVLPWSFTSPLFNLIFLLPSFTFIYLLI